MSSSYELYTPGAGGDARGGPDVVIDCVGRAYDIQPHFESLERADSARRHDGTPA